MSFNDDMIHSMKRLRLSGFNDVRDKNEDAVIVRISDISSPCSPVRKQSKGIDKVIERAVNAPFENTIDSESFNENTPAATTDSGKHVIWSPEFCGDTPLLNG